MKRQAIIVAMLFVVLASLLIGGSTSRLSNMVPVYIVVASDAATTFKRRGLNVWVCNGTQATGGDQVEIQAAVDRCADDGGGLVLLSGANFYGSFPTTNPGYGSTITVINDNLAKITADPTIDGTASTADGVSSVLHGIDDADWDAGGFGDWVLGDMMALTIGVDDSGGETLIQNHEECFPTLIDITDVDDATGITWTDATTRLTKTGLFAGKSTGDSIYISGGTSITTGWYTITAVDDDNADLSVDIGAAGDQADLVSEDALLLSERFENHSSDGTDDYTGVHVDKIIASVSVPPTVKIRGTGISGTRLNLATNADCALMMLWQSATGNNPNVELENIYFDGKRAQQTGTTGTYNALCPGLIISNYVWDVHVLNCSFIQINGDALVIDEGWGFQMNGGWLEVYNGKGVYGGDGNSAHFFGVKNIQGGLDSAQNCHALFLREGANQWTWIGGMLQSNEDWSVWIGKCDRTRIVGALIQSILAASEGGVRLADSSQRTIISGCTFRVDDTNASAIGIHFGRSDFNAVSGCVFHPDCPDAILEDTAWNATDGASHGHNTIGNVGLNVRETIETIRVTNNTGGNLNGADWMTYDTAEDANAVAQLAVSGVPPLGVLLELVNTGNDGYVTIRGYVNLAKVDNDAALAVGDRLTVSNAGDGAGQMEKAGIGDIVYAICESVENGDTDPANAEVTILPQTYIAP